MPEPRPLDPARAERVCQRLGLDALPAPDPDGLARLYRAWCRRVPFDNLRKRLHIHLADPGPLPGDSAEDFFDAWLATGAGGTCWAGNGALCALLRGLGFPARRGVATMLPPEPPPDFPPNHGTVSVDFGDGAWVVDASILHDQPLRLEAATPEHPAWGTGLREEGGRWHLHWRPLGRPHFMDCRIETLDAAPDEFAHRHERSRTHSHFNHAVTFRVNRADGLAGIVMGQAVARDAAGVDHATPLDGDAMRRHLVEVLGIAEALAMRLPDDAPAPEAPR